MLRWFYPLVVYRFLLSCVYRILLYILLFLNTENPLIKSLRRNGTSFPIVWTNLVADRVPPHCGLHLRKYRHHKIIPFSLSIFLISLWISFQVLALLLLTFNVHDYYYASNYIVWSRIISFIFAIMLFFAAICLIGGLNRVSNSPYPISSYNFLLFKQRNIVIRTRD